MPFALLPDGTGFVIHVSQLATHTQDMLHNPAVALLVTAPLAVGDSPLALPRASVQGHARPCPSDSPGYEKARQAYLTKLPIDEVKLDRSLITELSSDLQSQGMVRNIIRMAHDLNLVVTAEGIETQEQQQLLNAMDCDLIQGYYYSKPLTEKDFITILRQQPFAGGLSNAH